MEIGRRTILQLSVLAGLGLLVKPHGIMEVLAMEGPETFEVVKTEEEWKALLTPAQYYVLREEGTERPFTNAYDANKATGTYHCAGCDLEVFSSGAKYDSKTGWPSFWQPFSGRRSPDQNRLEIVLSQNRGPLQALWRSPWPYFQRWPSTDRPAVLYQLRSPSVSGSLKRVAVKCRPGWTGSREKVSRKKGLKAAQKAGFSPFCYPFFGSSLRAFSIFYHKSIRIQSPHVANSRDIS